MKLPRDLSSDDLIKSLSTLGYQVTRQTGSHIRLTTQENGEHHVTIPAHNPIKVISGILQPSSGTVKVKGKISPLIELEAGFDLNLSVRDNIILYRVMLGFSKQAVKKRIKYILQFAELEDYYLYPLKGLSSGMIARLGFAIATDFQPDILILDEVLSVGDEQFQSKCQKRMENFWSSETAILVVSHNLHFIEKFCDQAIFLDKGKITYYNQPSAVINHYLETIKR